MGFYIIQNFYECLFIKDKGPNLAAIHARSPPTDPRQKQFNLVVIM